MPHRHHSARDDDSADRNGRRVVANPSQRTVEQGHRLHALQHGGRDCALRFSSASWLGAALHAVPRLRRVFEPLLSAYYAVPVFIFYPLLIVAFGVGRAPLIVMGAMFGMVAMIVNTVTGPRSCALCHHARPPSVMKLGPLRRLVLVRLPAASPYLVTGVKLAVAYSVIGIVAGEFILATSGIGKRIAFGYQDFDNRTMYGMLLLLLIVVMIVNGVLSHWEKRLHHRFGQQ